MTWIKVFEIWCLILMISSRVIYELIKDELKDW